MHQDAIVIVSATRTPIGNILGQLSSFSAPQLASFCIQSNLKQTQLKPNLIHEVYLGCVLPAGVGQAPARQAALHAGLPVYIPCSTINKVCGSGMKAIMMAYDHLHVHPNHILIAGGMESMSQAPHLLPSSRTGHRYGHWSAFDHILRDGLEDAYARQPMGYFAETCATEYCISKDEQDEFSLTSLNRARSRIEHNYSPDELTSIPIQNKNQTEWVHHDERPFSIRPEKLRTLPSAFAEQGTVTAGNSSSLSDGASTLFLTRASHAKAHQLKPLARILAYQSHAQEPSQFTTAPIYAIQKLLHTLGWSVDDVDVFEINEAFAVVVLAAMKELHIPLDRINIFGGACALGHPIGASGARIVTTLLHNLITTQTKRGIAALCIGGGEATALAIERIDH